MFNPIEAQAFIWPSPKTLVFVAVRKLKIHSSREKKIR
jgi:hypothetical protein